MRTKQGAVQVVPKFELEGTENLPENLRLEDLGLAVSEIQLAPADRKEAVAYSSLDPLGLDFKVGQGEIERKGGEIVLPESGKFDVSLRLEPSRQKQTKRKTAQYSFVLSGYIAGDGVVRVDPRSNGENQDGDPVPFPLSPDRTDDDEQVSDKPALPKQWTPFKYRSQKSVVYTLDEVQFVKGKQYLSFAFDAEEWALELVKPLSEAVQKDSSPARGSNDRKEAVDVTQEIDRLGEGPEALADHMSVRTVRNPGGTNGPNGGGL